MKLRLFLLLAAIFSLLNPGLSAQSSAPALHYVQRIGERLPLDTTWTDETGQPITLGTALGNKPAVVVFGYYNCAQLCSLVERGTIDSLRELAPTIGRDYNFIYLSIDPTDQPEASRQERAASVRAYGRGDDLSGWHYLTADAATIQATSAAAGFQYRFDPGSRQFVHPAGMVLVTPAGVISRYYLGLNFRPTDLAAGLRSARQGATGPSVFNLVLECFQGGRGASRKERLIWDGLWAAVLLSVLALAAGIGWMLWAEHSGRRRSI